jgi:hypothetical protein
MSALGRYRTGDRMKNVRFTRNTFFIAITGQLVSRCVIWLGERGRAYE